jgi:site-specific DNA-methyltransferase (adenine-specific)
VSLYYQDDYVTLYHGDCLTEHREWLDADVLVTDPPYGTQFTKLNPNGGYGRRQKSRPEGFTVAGDLTTKTRDTALHEWGTKPALVFNSPRMPEPPGDWAERLVWDKVEPGMNGGPFRYTHENVFLRGEGWKRATTRSYSILRFPRSDGMGNAERSQHAHRKPVGLMEALISAFPTGAIADPFAGSGSTLVGARNLGRKVIGVEIEERYCEIIANRCAQSVLNLGGLA